MAKACSWLQEWKFALESGEATDFCDIWDGVVGNCLQAESLLLAQETPIIN